MERDTVIVCYSIIVVNLVKSYLKISILNISSKKQFSGNVCNSVVVYIFK